MIVQSYLITVNGYQWLTCFSGGVKLAGQSLLEKVYLLSQIVQDVSEASDIEKVAPFLTRSQFQVLKVLSAGAEKTSSQLADIFNISRPAISKTIDKLVKNLLVNRVDSESDRRSALLSLTLLGEKLIASYNHQRFRRLEEIQREFSNEEIVIFEKLVNRYINTLVAIDKNVDLICVQCEGQYQHVCSFKEFSENCSFKVRTADLK